MSYFKTYELTVIFDASSGELAAQKEADHIAEQIKGGFDFLFQESWGIRRLTYRIKKNREGFYVIYGFSGDPSLLQDFEQNLKLNNQVLRHLLLVVPAEYHFVIKEEADKTKADKETRPIGKVVYKRREKEDEGKKVVAPKEDILKELEEGADREAEQARPMASPEVEQIRAVAEPEVQQVPSVAEPEVQHIQPTVSPEAEQPHVEVGQQVEEAVGEETVKVVEEAQSSVPLEEVSDKKAVQVDKDKKLSIDKLDEMLDKLLDE